MYVVAEVAAATACRHVGVAAARISMAIVALQSNMCAVDRKIRMQVMIECRQRPVIAVMAGAAAFTEAAGVWIGAAVAIDALGRRIVKSITGVAGTTGDRGMQPCERK